MQEIVEENADESGPIMPVAVTVRQHEINTVEKELKQEPHVRKEILSLSNCSLSVSPGVTWDKSFRVRHSECKRRDCED